MRKLRLIKIAIPEIAAYHGDDPDFRCSDCGMGVDKAYKCCPYCKAELDWDGVKIRDERFLEMGIALRRMKDAIQAQNR